MTANRASGSVTVVTALPSVRKTRSLLVLGTYSNGHHTRRCSGALSGLLYIYTGLVYSAIVVNGKRVPAARTVQHIHGTVTVLRVSRISRTLVGSSLACRRGTYVCLCLSMFL